MDDLWAVAECYGYTVAEEWADHISRDALPRFESLFREQNIKATFFIVGRDLEGEKLPSPDNAPVAGGPPRGKPQLVP